MKPSEASVREAAEKAAEGLGEGRSCRSQLLEVKLSKLPQNPVTLACQVNADKASVTRAFLLSDQSSPAGALNQTHHRVVALLKEFGKLGDSCPASPGIARDPEEQLVLLRGDA